MKLTSFVRFAMEEKWSVLKKSEVKTLLVAHPAMVSMLTSSTPAFLHSMTRNYHIITSHPIIFFLLHNFDTRNGLTSLSWNITTSKGILSKIENLTKRR